MLPQFQGKITFQFYGESHYSPITFLMPLCQSLQQIISKSFHFQLFHIVKFLRINLVLLQKQFPYS